MDNLLLVFPHNVENIEEWNSIINKFDEKNYYVYILNDISTVDFDIAYLPGIIEYHKNLHENINKIVIMSNARDLILSWYRCYNSLVEDFIYFIDEDEKNFFIPNDEHFAFYYNLYEFNGIDKEEMQGKIYLNKKDEKVLPIYYNQKYFDSLSNFDFFNKREKKLLNKKYLFNDFEYSFTSNNKYPWDNIKIGKFNKRNKRIVVIKGQSQYDVLRIMSDRIIDEFQNLGHEVFVIDLLEENSDEICNVIFRKKIDFVFSFNAMGINLKVNNGTSIYNLFNIPFIGYMVDHPITHTERIKENIKKAIYIFSDGKYIEYMNSNFPNKRVVKLPIMAISNKKENIKIKDREIDVLFAGSLKNLSSIRKEWNNYGKYIKNIIESSLEFFLSKTNYPMIYAVENCINIFRTKISKKEYLTLKELVYFNLEEYVRTYRRYELLKNIAESKLEVICYTNDVEELQKINVHNNIQINKSVPFEKLLDLIGHSKMVLNISAQSFSGLSERVVSSMINGAVALTDINEYISKNFKNGIDILLYDKENMNQVPSIMRNNLRNIEQLQNIADMGKIKAECKYSTKKFAENILEVYEQFKSFD